MDKEGKEFVAVFVTSHQGLRLDGYVWIYCPNARRQARRRGRSRERVPVNLSRGVRVIRELYHIQNVNAFHSGLHRWLQRFRDVATKYLDNHLPCFTFVDVRKRRANSSRGSAAGWQHKETASTTGFKEPFVDPLSRWIPLKARKGLLPAR